MKVTRENEDLIAVRDDGTIIRIPIDQISIISRNTQGIRLVRVDEGSKVTSVALLPHQEDEISTEDEIIE